MQSTTIKKQIVNPTTGKRASRVFVAGKGWYGWNTVYHVYNRTTNYEQLKQADLVRIVWDMPKREGSDLQSPAFDRIESHLTPEQ